jgi:hypothetical protein
VDVEAITILFCCGKKCFLRFFGRNSSADLRRFAIGVKWYLHRLSVTKIGVEGSYTDFFTDFSDRSVEPKLSSEGEITFQVALRWLDVCEGSPVLP